ncbi:hypothetical protein ACPOL_0368 [Acidisarcina polymorpha]|uniref:Uncharacterized protein n=1 Tax=Acidisarcina polymorpha TaxID=2211140 RepID=A0A2Z5FSF2_9BACT|nr:hypothetical protein ACPOL_0368 [Acidisarcina polymorpha]
MSFVSPMLHFRADSQIQRYHPVYERSLFREKSSTFPPSPRNIGNWRRKLGNFSRAGDREVWIKAR